MDYEQAGFDGNLIRPDNQMVAGQEIDPLAFEQLTQDISGSKLSGFIKSQDGQLQMDLDNNSFMVTDGVVERVRLGQLLDGTYGLLIKDNNDQTLIQIGSTNLIQSPDGSLLIDFDNTQLLVKDSGGTPIILLGKQVGGF